MPLRIECVMRILILNLGPESLDATTRALSGQGYELVMESGLTVDQVLALSPEVLVTEATPSDLSCCGLVTQLKSRPETESPVKIVIVVAGGALERARALDLGADEAISFPFEPVEFAASVRAQFRERKPQEELTTMLKYAVQREHFADIAVESLQQPSRQTPLMDDPRYSRAQHRCGACGRLSRHFQPRHAQGDSPAAGRNHPSEQQSGPTRRLPAPR